MRNLVLLFNISIFYLLIAYSPHSYSQEIEVGFEPFSATN